MKNFSEQPQHLKPSLKIQTVTGAFWVGLIYSSNQVLTFIIGIILAWLLTPEDFGLVAMTLIVIKSLNLLQSLGLQAALIRWQDVNKYVTNTAFYLTVSFGLILVFVGYITAPYTASFFDNSQITSLQRILVFVVLFQAVGTIPAALMDKNFAFKRQFWPDTLPTLIYGGTTAILALNGFGVYSIVLGNLAGAFLRLLVLFFVSPWKPQLIFNVSIAKRLINYGKDITAISLFIFTFQTIDNIAVGKFAGEYALGLYTKSFAWANLSATVVTLLFGRVMFPALSKVQNNLVKMGDIYLRTFRLISVITIPIAFGIFSISNIWVNVLLSQQWLGMIPILQILAFYGLARSLSAVTGPVFMASGQQMVMLRIMTVQLVLTIILIYPASTFGVIGITLLFTLSLLIAMAVNIFFIDQILNIAIKSQLKILLPPLLAAAAMSIAILVVATQNWVSVSIAGLLFLIVFGGVIYIIILHLVSKEKPLVEIINLISSTLSTTKKEQ